MKIAIGADHAGFELKDKMAVLLKELGHEVSDFGTHSSDSVDYPDYALKVSNAVFKGEAERGILFCGSGIGVSIAANKVKGIRAAICHDTYSAAQGVEHNNMNVLCLGGRIIGPALAGAVIKSYLSAKFDGGERFVRRINKIAVIEKENNR